MSFKRLESSRPHHHDGNNTLNTRLVSGDDEVASDGPLADITSASAAAASGSGRRSVSASDGSASSASPSTFSKPSHNNPTNSSLSNGSHRDMELVELNTYDGITGSDSHTVHPNPRSSDRRNRSSSANAADDDEDEENPTARSRTNSNSSEARPARQWPSVLRDGKKVYLMRSFKAFFLSAKLNILLLAVPLAIISHFAGWGDGPLFVFALIGLCPLAERISFVTDEMAMYTNDTIGGLLSATMGNMTELIVSIFAIRNGLLRIVQLSLIGSIYSNLLLVQGTAFLVGGLKHSQQKFSQAAAKTNVGLLLLSVMALGFPMVLMANHEISDLADGTSLVPGSSATNSTSGGVTRVEEGISFSNELKLSRFTSVLMLIVYGLLIFYQLKTHAHLFESREEKEEDGEEPEPPVLGPWGSIIWAVIVTVFISILSEFIVSAIDGAASSLGLPVLFSATILLPIVGNAAEHASAIIFARRNQMDIALGISVGSSTQIALFVIPLMVILGWVVGQPLSLNFQVFETVGLFLTIILSSLVLSSGKSDWLYGSVMIMAYFVLAASFWWQNQPEDLK